jgi:RimJ/RimL family protein N-acetyltransferase
MSLPTAATTMNTIVADICILEPQMATHAREMFVALSDPAIYEFENNPPQSEEWLANRFKMLESTKSPDGKQLWLNWVVRLPNQELAGYVQATVLEKGMCYVAYELASKYWRKGLGRSAVTAMLRELASNYQVSTAVAVLKKNNFRSHALLLNLGFDSAAEEVISLVNPETDEVVMSKLLPSSRQSTS